MAVLQEMAVYMVRISLPRKIRCPDLLRPMSNHYINHSSSRLTPMYRYGENFQLLSSAQKRKSRRLFVAGQGWRVMFTEETLFR